MPSRAWLVRAVGVVLLTAAASPGYRLAAMQSAGLFVDAEGLAVPDSLLGRERSARHRAVRIAWLALGGSASAGPTDGALPAQVTLNLFPDTTLVAERGTLAASAAADATSFIGVVSGETVSYVNLTWIGPVMSGLVIAGSRVFEILPHAESGLHVIVERSRDGDRPEATPIPVPLASVAGATSDAAADTGNVLDVLYLYTTAKKTQYGGDPGIRARIAQAAADTNAVFANSQIPGLRVRIVAVKEINYVQTAAHIEHAMRFDLYNIQSPDDGVQDQIHVWRNTTGADMVQLVEGTSSDCGIAFLMGPGASPAFATNAFSVVDDNCIHQFSPAHELGHNLGSDHAAGDPLLVPAFSHSYGYKDPQRRFRTVMAYECAGGACPRIPMLSDDDLRYNGLVAGTATTQNAASVGETRYTAANWRAARFPELAPGQSGTPQVVTVGTTTTVSWTAPTTGSAAVGYRLYVGRTAGGSEIGAFFIGPPTVSGTLPAGTYYIRVAPISAGGEGPPSEETSFTIQGPAVPGAPTGLTATVIGRAVTLAWVRASGTVTGYIIEGGPASGSTAATANSAGTSFVSPPLADGIYFARVRAFNDAGSSGPSNEVSFRIGATAPPGPPINLIGTTRANTVILGWQAPSSGGAPTEYLVEAGGAPGGTNYGVFSAGLNLGLTTLAPSGRFFVRIRARNAVGTSAPSNEVVLNSGVNTCVGDFAARLDWDTRTDIDLHVNEPSGAHVFYGNRSGPTAQLDHDNTTGYGPENICVGAARAASGTYRIYVVPFGGSFWPTQATIDVRVFANSPRESGRTFTRLLPAANRVLGYNVANVVFPGGGISEVTGTRGVSDLIPTLANWLLKK